MNGGIHNRSNSLGKRSSFPQLRLSALLTVLVATTIAVLAGGAPAASADSIKAFVPVTPTRIVDTRDGLGGGRLSAGEVREVQMLGQPSVGSAAVAVALNVTAVQPASRGYLTVYPSGSDRPTASNLNYVPGENVANLVTVGIGADGTVSIYSFEASHVVVDVVGWYAAGFNPITPSRLMDTRDGLGGTTLGPGEQRELQIQSRSGLPSSSIGAVALNVTAVRPSSKGYITVWPAGTDRPTASNVNFVAGANTPNAVIVGVGSGGKISLFNSSGDTDLLVDVAGWFDVGFDAIEPTRLMDTREGQNGLALAPGETRNLKVIDVAGIPSEEVGAVSLNVTAVRPTSKGFLTVWPAGRDRPVASTLNFQPGLTRANATTVGVGTGGEISIYNSSGTTEVLVDITGWYISSDSEPPVMESLSVSPTSVNTSLSAQVVTATARITDDLSGLKVSSGSQSAMSFQSPTGNQRVLAVFNPDSLESGTLLDGTHSYEMTLPRFSESGVWTIEYIWLFDEAGNDRYLDATEAALAGHTTTFTVTGESDTEPPVMESLSVSPTSVNTSLSAQVVTATARITDDLSGLKVSSGSQSAMSFQSPTGNQRVLAVFNPDSLESGTLLDGTHSYEMTLPRFSESGVWTIEYIWLFDEAGNDRYLDATEAALAGHTTTFTVD